MYASTSPSSAKSSGPSPGKTTNRSAPLTYHHLFSSGTEQRSRAARYDSQRTASITSGLLPVGTMAHLPIRAIPRGPISAYPAQRNNGLSLRGPILAYIAIRSINCCAES